MSTEQTKAEPMSPRSSTEDPPKSPESMSIGSQCDDETREETTSKHLSFVNSKIGDSKVSVLPGIGPRASAKLKESGIEEAYVILGRFMAHEKKEGPFIQWLRSKSGAAERHLKACYEGLKEWCEKHKD